MNVELTTILISVGSAVAGWFLRHWGIVGGNAGAPQSRPAPGGAVPPAPVSTDLRSELRALVAEEIQRGLAALEGRLAGGTKGS